ncbi:MAG: carbohydrate kinase family protein [Rhizobiales bacterium]|nr:carbohydrate kinase family protein [Hyphomicrobiales bacterium]NRB15301.1 carbohydrate kinase family protein [Hyphomicrobiales bacterium]
MKALTIGGATNDFIAIIEDELIERMTMHNATSSYLLFEEGHKVEAKSIDVFVGGGAANGAVSMARLGFDVASIVKIGNDYAGKNVTDVFATEGIDASRVIITENDSTGRAVMVSSHVKNPTIFVYRGANTRLRTHEISHDHFAGMDLIYITGLSGDSSAAFPHIVSLAKNSGAKVAANPGIRQLSSRSEDFYHSLNSIDILSLNAAESAQLVPFMTKDAKHGELVISQTNNNDDESLGTPELVANGLTCAGINMTLGDFFATIINLGLDTFVLTNGKEGAYIGNKDGVYFCNSRQVEVKGTAGAGDAFFSTFASLYVDGASVEDAVHAATLNSASVVGQVDTQSGLLKRSTLKQQLKDFDNSACVTYKFRP